MRRTAASLALERGTQFVLARQSPDGLWRDFLTPAGEASDWPTGFIATALHLVGAEPGALERAADRLVSDQHADGGWGYNENVPSDADSTAYVLLFLARMGRGGGACRRAASCLVGHQRTGNGGVATYCEPEPIRRFMGVGRWMRFKGWCSPHTEVTATAGRALATLIPDDRSPEADAAWRYVRSRQRADGSWGSYWWTSPHYATLQAVELALVLGDRDPVARAAGWAIRSQSGDGGWSAPGAVTSAFATAVSLSILLDAGANGQPVERAIARLVALQEDDGGWPSHPIMRIPLPGEVDPDRWRLVRLGGGVVVRDQHRTFTTAACLGALARSIDTTPGAY
jgi:squalene-hopene/tetraprenyl-beta-curcumene cyclase